MWPLFVYRRNYLQLEPMTHMNDVRPIVGDMRTETVQAWPVR